MNNRLIFTLTQFALVAAVGAANVSAAADRDPLPGLIKKVQPAIVTVVGYDEKGEPAQLGTGFFVDRRGHLITNRHVLAGVARAEVKGSSGRTYAIERVLSEDAAVDLIKVQVDIPLTRVRILKMEREAPEPGERVVVIGSPYGLEKSVSEGIVSTVREAGEFGRMIQITAPISSGSSGSPVMRPDGRVVGVATVQVSDAQNLNFAVPTVKAIELKNENPQKFADWAADTHEKAGLKAAAAGKFDVSLELYQKALSIRPGSSKALNGAGMALHALGRYDEALEAYEHAAALDPEVAIVHYHIGELYDRRSEWSKSIESYDTALKLNPAYAAAHHNIAVALQQVGAADRARQHYEQLKNIDAPLASKLLEELDSCCDPAGSQ